MLSAFMIIAHKNIDQVIRLVRILEDDEIDFYIHLDKKWKLNDADIERLKAASRHVTVVNKRISGFLDTWSLCEITIELIKSALRTEKDYSYFALLSGQDYPIKSIEDIKNTFEQRYPKPLIDCTPMVKDNWIYSGFKWIRFHGYYRMVERIAKSRKARKLLLLPAYAVQFVVTYIAGSPYKRLMKADCALYGGSAWWILPREIVELCVAEVESNTEIVKAFKLKNTPEETFFQTMTMRSSLSSLVDINEPYEVLQNCMTYAYFFDDTHEPTGHPYILTEDNFEMLRNRRELFARKFEMNESLSLMDRIDREILGRESYANIDHGISNK